MIRRRGAPVAFAAFLALLVVAGPNASAAPAMRVLDDFSDVSAWRASASDDVSAKLRRDGDGSLCLDFDFGGVSGYAVLRRELALGLPQDYAFHVRVKGSGPRNDLQFKLLDASGDNVWWATLPAFVLPAQPTDLRFKRRHISFAWGPTQDRELRRTHTIEFVLAAGAGGRGSFCLQRLALEERATEAAPRPPRVTASAAFIDAKFIRYDGAPCYPGQSDGCMTVVDPASGTSSTQQNLAGKPMPDSPKVKLTLALEHELQPGFMPWGLRMNVQYAWRSAANFQADQNPQTRQGAFGLLNLGATATSPNGRHALTLFVNNATNKFYLVNAEDFFSGLWGGTSNAVIGQPARDARRYGGIRYAFNFD